MPTLCLQPHLILLLCGPMAAVAACAHLWLIRVTCVVMVAQCADGPNLRREMAVMADSAAAVAVCAMRASQWGAK